mmetsp:Transcript_20135/g.23211  ORF Transcript_20135/g.23211 Transcript_20135/m.23211 type:complete len:231 (-) Transcript_20135:308-1000(-)
MASYVQEEAAAVDEFQPTSIRFAKPIIQLPAMRIEAFVMTFLMLLVFCFEVSAAATAVFKYHYTASSGAITHITVYHQTVQLCLKSGSTSSGTYPTSVTDSCQTFKSTDRLCDALSSRVSAAGGFCIAALCISIVGFINGIFEIRGKTFVTPLATYVVSGVTWVLLFFHFVLDSAAFEEDLCSNMSLKGLHFSYRSGWVLGFVAWLLLSFGIVFYWLRRRLHPIKFVFSA